MEGETFIFMERDVVLRSQKKINQLQFFKKSWSRKIVILAEFQ